MTKNKTQKTYNSSWLLSVLFIIFLVLKLNPGGHLDTVVKDWSWWWVTAPLWAIPALVLVVLVVIFISKLFLAVFGVKNERR